MGDTIKQFLFAIVIVGIFICGGRLVRMSANNVSVKAYVEDKLVFTGKLYEIKVDSTGATTKLIINNGFLYMFAENYYVSKNIKVEGNK